MAAAIARNIRGCANHPGKTEGDNFGPRFGGAYRLDPKTVFRAGGGIFWDGVEGREMDDSGDLYPYITRQSKLLVEEIEVDWLEATVN
ncbi:MAG: hypothetical protein WBE56_20055 [Terracidiphilus sp.]